MKNCIHCKGKLKDVLFLGKIPIVNEFYNQNLKKYKLNYAICKNCKLFQHKIFPKKKKIFNKNYPYLSSTSNSNKIFFRSLKKKLNLQKNDFIVDIGSNDGAFLENFNSSKIKHLGIDPSFKACKIARKKQIKCINGFFDSKLSRKIVKNFGKADIIFSSNTLAHIENLNDVLKGIKILLKENGKLYLQNIYLYDVIKNGYFDQLYHEHLFTYSIESVNNIFPKYGLYVNNIEFNNIQGGSFLIQLSKKKSKYKKINKLISKEKKLSLLKKINQRNFKNTINKKLIHLSDFIKKIEKKKVCGYGASAKCVMTLNLLKLKKKQINFIVDNTKFKQNKLIPGTNIPIISPKKFQKLKIDYCIIFTWNYSKEIIANENNKKINWIMLQKKIRILKK